MEAGELDISPDRLAVIAIVDNGFALFDHALPDGWPPPDFDIQAVGLGLVEEHGVRSRPAGHFLPLSQAGDKKLAKPNAEILPG